MHNENAGDAGRLAKMLNSAGRDWANVGFEERLDLIRTHHHEISADMVIASVRNGSPPIGFTLKDQDRPAEVAAICEAHCVGTESPRYDELMPKPERPAMRLRLLAAILRLADILDEAQHRALVAQAHALDLNLESRMHWWRHYYTRDVEIDHTKNRVTIVFEFPAGKHERFKKLVPPLQMPWVEKEFERHRAVLAENGLNWHLSWVVQEAPFDTLEQMPPEVETYMLQELARRKQNAVHQVRIDLLAHFDESRASLLDQLHAAEANRANVEPANYLQRVLRLTQDLSELGSHITAQSRLSSAISFATTNGRSVEPRLHVDAATRLAEMRRNRNPRDSVMELARVEGIAEALPDGAPEKVAFFQLFGSLAMRAGAFQQGTAAARKAVRLLGKSPATEYIRAEIAEATLLEGLRVTR